VESELVACVNILPGEKAPAGAAPVVGAAAMAGPARPVLVRAAPTLRAGVTSVYKWKGAVEVDEEHMLVVKTPAHNRDAVTALVRRLHSYDTPEVLFLPVEGGSADYLAWVAEATRPAE